jgi:hypothetical protein
VTRPDSTRQVVIVAHRSDGLVEPGRPGATLAERAQATVAGSDDQVSLIVCDVRAVDRPDLATIDALARLALVAKRHRARLRLRGAGRELRDLLGLTGLAGLGGAASSDRVPRSGGKAGR